MNLNAGRHPQSRCHRPGCAAHVDWGPDDQRPVDRTSRRRTAGAPTSRTRAATRRVTARAGGMNLQALGGAGVAQIINTTTAGAIKPSRRRPARHSRRLDATSSTNSGIFKNGPGGLQKVTAAGITLQGASTGTNAGAGIRSQGDQLIDVSGDINLRGGNGGTGTRRSVGATPGSADDLRPRHQHEQRRGRRGHVAAIIAGRQEIDATGNVTLTSQGALVSARPPADRACASARRAGHHGGRT